MSEKVRNHKDQKTGFNNCTIWSRYGGKNELATEFDSCVAGLCVCLEAVFLHGLRAKPLTSQTPVNTTLKQVSDIVAHSLNIRQENICKCPVTIACLSLLFVWIVFNNCKVTCAVVIFDQSQTTYKA